MLKESDCDAIMLARGAQGNPWVFKQIQHFLDTGEKIEQPSLKKWRNIILRHVELLLNLKEKRIAVSEIRKNLAFILKESQKLLIIKFGQRK